MADLFDEWVEPDPYLSKKENLGGGDGLGWWLATFGPSQKLKQTLLVIWSKISARLNLQKKGVNLKPKLKDRVGGFDV